MPFLVQKAMANNDRAVIALFLRSSIEIVANFLRFCFDSRNVEYISNLEKR